MASTSTHPTSSASSLILAHRPTSRLFLILGSSKLAASRARTALEAGAFPLILSSHRNGIEGACLEIQRGVAEGRIGWRNVHPFLNDRAGAGEKQWSELLDELDEDEAKIFALCVTDTLLAGEEEPHQQQQHHSSSGSIATTEDEPEASGSTRSSSAQSLDRAATLARLCRKKRIPINVADRPTLCDFSFPATHRFPATNAANLAATTGLGLNGSSASSSAASSSMSSLQIAVTTNGRGCRLAGRIRRDIVSALPRNVGDAVERVGEMRDLAKQEGNQSNRGRITATSTAQGLQQEEGEDFFAHGAARAASKPRSTKAKGPTSNAANGEEDDLSYDTTPLNSPVPQLATPQLDAAGGSSSLLSRAFRIREADKVLEEEEAERTKRRMRWVAQISEYWPIEYLGGMSKEQMAGVLKSFGERDAEAAASSKVKDVAALTPTNGAAAMDSLRDEAATPTEDDRGRSRTPPQPSTTRPRARSQHSLSILPPPLPLRNAKGRIYLVGSGPGHPGLLTLLAHRLLTSPDTHLILSDKLVPSSILNLIPPTTPLIIARKFPGNAEGAQSELISLALEAALNEGKNVIRLKQGDPFVYGRGGEEVLAFRAKGIEPTVVPGISSAIAAPLMVGIPVTQRGAADSLVLCTGVGRGGKKVKLPGYERGRSLIVLMGVARLKAVVEILTKGYGVNLLPPTHQEDQEEEPDRAGPPFPPHTPIAIIERASSSDQRLLASTLEHIDASLEHFLSSGSGEQQRPPGMILIGWSVLSLQGPGEQGNVDVLDDERNCFDKFKDDVEEARVELERRDRQRVAKWLSQEGSVVLGEKRYIVKEGLDDVYADALKDLIAEAKRGRGTEELEVAAEPAKDVRHTLDASTKRLQSTSASPSIGRRPLPLVGTMTPPLEEDSKHEPVHPIDHSLPARDESGWAPARYPTQAAVAGGWGQGEKPFEGQGTLK